MKRILSLSLLAGVAVTAGAQTYTGGGGAIPDGDLGGFNSTITIATNPLVVGTFVNIKILGLTHTWVGDLSATLTKTGGASVDLFIRPGREIANNDLGSPFGQSDDLAGDFIFDDAAATTLWAESYTATGLISGGTFKPAGQYISGTGAGSVLTAMSLSSFAGTVIDGDWVLNISDRAELDTGEFTGWEFTVTAVPEPGTLLAIGAGLALLAARRRK